MHLAVYHPWVYLPGGIERCLVELVERSRHDWTVYTHHFDRAATFPALASANVVLLSPRVSTRRSLGPLAVAGGVLATSLVPPAHAPATALLVSSEGLGDLVALRARVPSAVYCHTPLKILHDPTARTRLAERSPRTARVLDLVGPAFERVDRIAWRRYRHAFANSEETRRRIRAARLVPAGPVEVLPPGVDSSFFHPGPPADFCHPGPPAGGSGRRGGAARFVAPGRIMWQKNLELAIDSAAELAGRGVPAELTLAGFVDRKSAAYLAQLRARSMRAGLELRVETNPSDARLRDLYRSAAAVLLTAPGEDFGIVALEAMACGTPVLAVDASGYRETVEDSRTGFLLPADPVRFADAMSRLSVDPGAAQLRRRLSDAAVRRAAEFSWQRFAARIDTVMEALAGGPQ